MLIKYGNLLQKKADAYCITTNGFVKKNGEAVMGKGIAKTIKNKFPDFPESLGEAITKYGNIVHVFLGFTKQPLVTLPVKGTSEIVLKDRSNVVRHCPIDAGKVCPGFWLKANLQIIKSSLIELVREADINGWETINMPRMGCGAGELDWITQVKPLMQEFLDDRFNVYTFIGDR